MNEVQIANQLRGSFAEAVLLQINEEGGKVDRERLEQIAGSGEGAAEMAVALEGAELVAEATDMSGELRLSPFGRRVADRIRTSMVSGPRRADAVQRAVLSWLNGQTLPSPSLHDFLATADALVSGIQVTQKEVSEARDLLLDRGFITVARLAESSDVQPSITPDGRAALHADVMITDYGHSNPTTISYDHSSKINFGDNAITGGFVSGGQGHTQHVQQTIGQDVRSDLAGQVANLRTLAEDLPDDTPGLADVRQALAALSDEAEKPEAQPSVLQELTLKAFTAGAAAAGTSGGQLLIEGLAQLAKTLGS